MRRKPWIDALIMRFNQENVSYMERDQLMYEKSGLETAAYWSYDETMSYFIIIENCSLIFNVVFMEHVLRNNILPKDGQWPAHRGTKQHRFDERF